MQEFVDKNESSSDVRDRLTLFQRGHREGNHALIERLAQDYQDEAHLEYFAKDDAVEDELVDVRRTSNRFHMITILTVFLESLYLLTPL